VIRAALVCVASAALALAGQAPPKVPELRPANSARLQDLIRAGNLYLSLRDAVALAVENNLDVEFQRYTIFAADADRYRAAGGGTTRGLVYTIGEAPAGVGGPASPLLIATGARPGGSTTVPGNFSELGVLAGPQTNLSVLGSIQFSTGPALPQYDPAITGVWSWTHQTAPQTNLSQNGTSALVTESLLANAGIQKGFITGTQVGLGFNNNRQTLNSPHVAYSPYTASNAALTLTQPLLRGFGRAVNRRFLRIAANEQRISKLLLRQQLIATVYGVTRLYIDLVALAENVKVKEQSVAVAERFREDTRAQVEEGTAPEIELTRANAQVSAANQELINARGLFEEQEALLKSVLTREGLYNSAVAAAHIVPTDPLELPAEDTVRPVQDLVGDALANRPDLAQAGLQVENGRISLEGARNALRPQLDLVGTMQNAGLAGQLNPLAATPEFGFLGGYGSALGQIAARNYPTYGIGLQLNLPLRNRVAEADAARDEVLVRQAEIRATQMRNQARLEIEDALIAMRRARAAYDAAVQTRTLQEQSVEAERARMGEGLSTGFFLMQYENLLAQARSTELVSKAAYMKARAALQRATGGILDELGVSVN
jgi:outer membrane protein